MAAKSTTRSQFWPGETGKFVLVWAGLVVLLALTMAVSLVDAGIWNIVANLGIALLKAALVIWFFMHLDEIRGIVRLFALGVLVWVGILFVLSMADYLTRPF